LNRFENRLREYALLMRLASPHRHLSAVVADLVGAVAGRATASRRAALYWCFVLGVALMRSAGCVINDIADRHFDPKVARTRDRPLAAGRVSVWAKRSGLRSSFACWPLRWC
jgi:4-hydroxybenzoate polyprenyltransferase